MENKGAKSDRQTVVQTFSSLMQLKLEGKFPPVESLESLDAHSHMFKKKSIPLISCKNPPVLSPAYTFPCPGSDPGLEWVVICEYPEKPREPGESCKLRKPRAPGWKPLNEPWSEEIMLLGSFFIECLNSDKPEF